MFLIGLLFLGLSTKSHMSMCAPVHSIHIIPEKNLSEVPFSINMKLTMFMTFCKFKEILKSGGTHS